jgi:DNA-binding IclR family transcriptional regulator
MERHMQDLNDLVYFAEVVDRGGFAAAGRALGLPKSRLSRRVAELEARNWACACCSAPRASCR